MPAGVPVATMAIGVAGAANAGLMAARVLAASDIGLYEKLEARRAAVRDGIRNLEINS